MKKRIVYADEPADVDLENAVRGKDFLPSPGALILRKERVVTLRLDDSTISELKAVADQKGLGVSTLVRMWVRERLTNAHVSS
jgi:predicted DNA binding CopG/RHH family protein